MTSFRPKLFTSLAVAALLGGSGLAACSPDGEAGDEGADAGNVAASTVPAGEGGEGGAEGGAGEAGAQAAYVGVPAESRVALRLAHLKGFFLVAQKVSDADEAAALAGQGMLEVYDAQPDAFRSAGVEEAALRKAADTGSKADLAAAVAAIDAAQARAGGDPSAVTKGLLDIATGLYAGVVTPDGVDPIEYQHSYGAALSAKQAFDAAAKAKPSVKSAEADMTRFLALWPAPTAPEKPTAPGEVSAQASRVQLALN